MDGGHVHWNALNGQLLPTEKASRVKCNVMQGDLNCTV